MNGDIPQQSTTADLCFGVTQPIAFCSQGQTLQRGSLIMTGAPVGVGIFMITPIFLQDEDVLTVETGGIRRISNRIEFSGEKSKNSKTRT
jgi:2-keto-4-pentenoate hydratase/2-oxohepta-3-ene-1,7-dioic acid hydratase in catechol pathway